MPQNPAARPRPRAVDSLAPPKPLGPRWSVDLRLVWDASLAYGWVTGSAWSPEGNELLELPATDLEGTDIQDDVVLLLNALWRVRKDVQRG